MYGGDDDEVEDIVAVVVIFCMEATMTKSNSFFSPPDHTEFRNVFAVFLLKKWLFHPSEKQEPRGKALILHLFLDQIMLEGDGANFLGRPPFDAFFDTEELASAISSLHKYSQTNKGGSMC